MNNNLLSGRNMLNESTKSEILSLTKEAEDDVEKAKIVYQYVQDKTRYISVQVGIGGIQPIAANEVDQVSYGDCKGLTNYTKALLDVVGVTSYYTHVEAGRNKVSFEKDFASLEQGNHVILNIPNKGNDVWLECTSQTVPFGFLGDFTDDRDVLVMTPEGGIMKRTPKYINEDNLQTITAKIKLTDVGNAIAKLERKSYGIQYDGKYLFKNKSIEDLKKHYKSSTWDYNNNLEVTAVNLDNNKDKIEFTEVVDITINEYATKQDSSFIFKVNVFNRLTNIPKRYRKRDKPFTIDRGFVDRDELVVELPEGYSLESLPENKELKTKYGMYKVSFEKLNATTIKYKREVFLKDGIYPKEDYKSYRKFRKSIAKYDNLRIALTKK